MKKGLLFLIIGWIILMSIMLFVGQYIPNQDGKWESVIIVSFIWFSFGGVAISCDKEEN